MDPFLAKGNLCGQTLLRIVSRGNAIIAELLRLSKNIPVPILSSKEEKGSKYSKFIFGFEYFKDPDEIEKRINSDSDLLEAELEFQETYGKIIERIYGLFESIWRYYVDLSKFFSDVHSGFFIQHSIEGILYDSDGKQLTGEALYLYGIMLLFLEYRIPGPVRERIVVSHCRYVGEAGLESFAEVCRLARATQFIPKSWGKKPVDKDAPWFLPSTTKYNRPDDWPETLFSRFSFPENFVRMLIGRFQSDDVYHMTTIFPNTDHRSARLATQAAMLYVLLYFCPTILLNEPTTMREIVDRYFLDNWIITIYMGHQIDLSAEWFNYPAAKSAMENVLQSQNVYALNDKNRNEIDEVIGVLQTVLAEGVLTESYLLDNCTALFNLMRQSNTSLRWRMLHRHVKHRRFKELLLGETAGVSMETMTTLLLLTAQLEFVLRSLLEKVLGSKAEGWARARAAASQRTIELADYFTGEKALTRVQRNESLVAWFQSLSEEIRKLEYEDQHTTVTGRKIQTLINALKEVEQFDQLDNNLQVKAFLEETRAFLLEMIRAVGVQSSMLAMMDTVSDLSYAWGGALQEYIPILHSRIQQDPTSVTLLRAMFLKLTSILDIPLVRINQCNSPDIASVAEYYSSELVEFVRAVLKIIPTSVFEILQKIVTLEEEKFKPVPNRIEGIHLKDYAQLDEQYELAKLTHQVSKFTEGILQMEKTLLGVIQVDPRKILEEGIRAQLVQQIANALDNSMLFPEGYARDFEKKAESLATTIAGYRRAIEYIQDFIDLPGTKIWQEELSRVINYNIEFECKKLLKKSHSEGLSEYQSQSIPIPLNLGSSFMSRILDVLLELTSPEFAIYSLECGCWFLQDGTELCGIKTFAVLNHAIDVIGMSGLDKLLGYFIIHQLKNFVDYYNAQIRQFHVLLETTRASLSPVWKKPSLDVYSSACKQLQHVLPELLGFLGQIGQATLLRAKVVSELQFSCRLSADMLQQALSTLDKAVVKEIWQYASNPAAEKPELLDEKNNDLVVNLSKMLRACGLVDTSETVYITTHPLEALPVLLLLFLIHYTPKLMYDKEFGSLIRKKSSSRLDGGALVAGMSTLLHQFHPSYKKNLLQYIGQYVQTNIHKTFEESEGQKNWAPG